MPHDRLHVQVSGRVQGVGFRYFTEREASRLGLTGWVRNLPDGSVEIVAEGPRESLEALIGIVRVGPRGGRVDDLHVRWSETDAREDGFRVRY
jgi:acylphosphatase